MLSENLVAHDKNNNNNNNAANTAVNSHSFTTPTLTSAGQQRVASNGGGSSSGGTLADESDAANGSGAKGFQDGLPAPEGQIGLKRSAHSSMDHVAELGEGRVFVKRGKEEFAALGRKLSNMSQRSQELQRTSTRASSFRGFTKPTKVMSLASGVSASDAEKGRNAAVDEK